VTLRGNGTRPEGAVFDLDGTLVDNMALHGEAFARFCANHGLPPFTAEMRARLDGKRNRDIFPVLFGRELPEEELRAFTSEKEGLYRELSCGRLTPLPGLVDLLDALDSACVPIALATSAPAENVEHTLRELGLRARLTRVLRSDQVARGKPHPDVFLAAAAALRARPDGCVAFEDAPMGVLAARAAGMHTVAVTTTFTPAAFEAAGATPHEYVADFAEYRRRLGWLP
jgi:HAD superfamily hydrolase (TIGR01509 family)